MKKIIYIVFALALSTSLHAQIDRSVRPKPAEAPKINLGKPHSFELPNGLKVLVVENHKLPRVTFALTLDNPPSLEGSIKGVDYLASNMMGNGTSKIAKDDFNEKIDYYGASAYFGVNSIGGSSLAKYFPEVLTLVAQGGLDPLLTEDELNSERAKLLDGLKSQEKNAQSIAQQVRTTLLFGQQHPMGEVLTKETVNNVNLVDIENYYKNYFVPENAYLVIVGDVKLDEVKKLVIENFSSWKNSPITKDIYTEPVNLTKTEIDFVDVPNAVQSEIAVANLVDLKMTDPHYFAALLANDILGGGANGRLFLNLREKHGWTYGAYSSLSGSKRLSPFIATASVRNSVTDSAIVEMMNEVEKIRTTLPTQEELDLTKASYIGNFVMNAEKPETVAGFALREKTQSLPADFYENYIKNIDAVTLEDVQSVAKKYILDNGSRIVVVGKAEEVLPSLEQLGIQINYFDKYGNSTTKPEKKTVSNDVTVNNILSKYIEAIGGETALSQIKTLSYTAKAQIQGQELTLKKVETAEGKSLQMMEAMGMTMFKSVYNGETGYAEMQGQRQDMTPEDLAELKYKGVFPELKMLNSTTLKLAGVENINGIEAYKLVDGITSYYYDVNSGLKIAEGIKKEVQPGQEIEQSGTYSDYREIDGIKIPYKLTLNVGVDIELNVTDVKINEGVSDKDFE